MIIELGTGMGISTIYLFAGSPETPLHSIEHNRERAALAAQLICRCCPGPVSIHVGRMEEKLEDVLLLHPKRFVAFVDGNHHYEPTVAYLERLLDRAGDEAVIVMDDIYWSRGMQRAWKEMIARDDVRVSIDLFHMGILLIGKELQKKNFKIKF
jgi:predicted O-methyltransferase YrrM